MSTSLADQTAAWKTASEADQNGFGAFVRLDLPGYTARFFTGAGVIEWDDGTGTQEWIGAPLGDIDGLTGSVKMQAQTVNLSLSGLDSSLKTEIMDYLVRGSEVYIWMFYIESGSIVTDPWLAFAGEVDVPEFEEGDEVTLQVECLDAVGAAFRKTVTRRTDEDQQRRFTGDRFYEFAARTTRERIKWGVPWENAAGGGGSGDVSGNGRPGPIGGGQVSVLE